MSHRIYLLVICLGGLLSSTSGAHTYIEKNEAIFFPKEYGETLELYKSFRTLWWNFLAMDSSQTTPPAELADICEKLRKSGLANRVECGDSLKELLPIAESWARDLPARQPAPSVEQLKQSFAKTLAQASLPIPSELLKVLRVDPLGSYHVLENHALARQPLLLERRGGFFYDAQAGKWAIPFRPAFPPSDNESMQRLLDLVQGTLPKHTWWVVGSHASSAENRGQIETDLGRMSSIGTFFVIIFVFVVWRLKRLRLLWGLPMTFLGEAIGAGATILVFGSIHGLVLSFGIRIMGLLLDYTFHGAFKSRSTRVWYSNLMGLITTLAAFFVLGFSKIPLLRQLAFFSIVGLTASFGLIYLVHRVFAERLCVEPLNSRIRDYRVMRWVAAGLGAGLCFSFWVFVPKFDMRQFDFQSPRTRALYTWLGDHVKYKQTLLEILPGSGSDSLQAAHDRNDWAKQNGLDLENLAFYVPPVSNQTENLTSWRTFACHGGITHDLSGTARFFEPFFEATQCDRLSGMLGVDLKSPPLYLSDMEAKGRWLNIWFPATPAEMSDINRRYPDATSFIDLVNEFPKTITHELIWMIPVCFFLILASLWIYYRSLLPAFAALLPFLIGLGAVAWARMLGMPFSFVSLIGVTMLLGLGVDYGIFSVDHDLFVADNPGEGNEKGLTSALLFAAVTTIAGYLPLLFCGHQVLVHLGQVLSIGTLGSMVGAFWAAPQFLRWVRK